MKSIITSQYTESPTSCGLILTELHLMFLIVCIFQHMDHLPLKLGSCSVHMNGIWPLGINSIKSLLRLLHIKMAFSCCLPVIFYHPSSCPSSLPLQTKIIVFDIPRSLRLSNAFWTYFLKQLRPLLWQIHPLFPGMPVLLPASTPQDHLNISLFTFSALDGEHCWRWKMSPYCGLRLLSRAHRQSLAIFPSYSLSLPSKHSPCC